LQGVVGYHIKLFTLEWPESLTVTDFKAQLTSLLTEIDNLKPKERPSDRMLSALVMFRVLRRVKAAL